MIAVSCAVDGTSCQAVNGPHDWLVAPLAGRLPIVIAWALGTASAMAAAASAEAVLSLGKRVPSMRGRGTVPRRPDALALRHLGRLGELADLDLAHQLVDLARVDQAGAEARRGFRAARDAEAQAFVGRAALVAGRDVAGQEGVARADGRDRLAGLDHHAKQRLDAVDQHAADAAVGHRHDRLARAEREHLAHRDQAILLVVELVADELLGLED